MKVTAMRWISGVAIGVLAMTAPGCALSSDADSEEVNGADETVAASADALSGNATVGATLRTTTGLNLRAGAGTNHAILVTMPAGATVTVRQAAPVNGFYAVRYGSRDGWAHGAYLVPAGGGGGGANVRILGPAVRAHVQRFANAACAAYGCPYELGTRVGHDPSADRAVDMMQSKYGTAASGANLTRGTSIAGYGVSNAAAHKVYYVIWRQRINTIDGRGWRVMADRGSITQNHYDHVHVSFDP